MMSEELKIRPYARLITMLGDQLIKNEQITLTELIKNSYDADASWVKVSFIDFKNDFTRTLSSKIIIEDDGCGMNAEIIRKHWLNPATPDKLNRKKVNEKTQKGRILQGEKGIGRFAVFKLGKTIKIITRRQVQQKDGSFIDSGESVENVLYYDFSKYDEDFQTEDGLNRELFLDDLSVNLSQEAPQRIVSSDIILGAEKVHRHPYGTIIEISNLKTGWTRKKVERIQNDIGKLQPIFSEEAKDDFRVWIYRDEQLLETHNQYKNTLLNCLEHKSVFQIKDGKYTTGGNKIDFRLNGKWIHLSFDDPDINGLSQFRNNFGSPDYQTECGDRKLLRSCVHTTGLARCCSFAFFQKTLDI